MEHYVVVDKLRTDDKQKFSQENNRRLAERSWTNDRQLLRFIEELPKSLAACRLVLKRPKSCIGSSSRGSITGEQQY